MQICLQGTSSGQVSQPKSQDFAGKPQTKHHKVCYSLSPLICRTKFQYIQHDSPTLKIVKSFAQNSLGSSVRYQRTDGYRNRTRGRGRNERERWRHRHECRHGDRKVEVERLGGQVKMEKTYPLSWTSPVKEPCLQKSSA